MSTHLKLSLPSDTDYLKCIEAFFMNFLSINSITDRMDSHEVFLAMVEGIVNAVKHGNGSDAGKNVIIELCFSGNMIKIVIEDQGRGFDPDRVEDPTKPGNITTPGGRGIFLIRKLMNSVEYDFSSKGTRLIMIKNLEQGGEDGV